MATTDTAALAEEHASLTERCGLVDRSERGKLALTGSGAVEFLNGQLTNELVGLKPGEGRYAAFLTHKGKMLGDLRVLAVGDDPDVEPSELLLDTERVALQALFDMIRRFKVGYDVELHKRTLECSLLSLIGPTATEVATRAFLLEPSSLRSFGASSVGVDVSDGGPPNARVGPLLEAEHDHLLLSLGDTPARLIRTDLGFDVLFETDAVDAARAALVDAGAVEVSEAAAEIVRVEHGRPRYGLDLEDTTIPQEAGLNERAVSFTKGCYVGQETVARLHYKGKPNRHLRGLRLSEQVEPGAELRLGERAVGHLGSSVLSPTFGAIGLALVRREAEPGAALEVGHRGAHATVTELPFKPI
ncbi:MAG: glycine cleavage T C-terminal barrel domain-containing protein [Solirubrobacteraceae bacterium]